MSIKDMPCVTVEQVFRLREAAIELEKELEESRQQCTAYRISLDNLETKLKEEEDISGIANLRYMEKCKELDILKQSLPKIKADAVHDYIQDLSPKWVSVDDELPITEIDDSYATRNVIASDGNHVCEMMFRAGCTPELWFEWSIYGDLVPEDITHWMPLPELPKPPTQN